MKVLSVHLGILFMVSRSGGLKETAVAGRPSVTRLTHSGYSLEHHIHLLAPANNNVVTLPINFHRECLTLVHIHGLVDLIVCYVLLVLEILHVPGGTLLLGPSPLFSAASISARAFLAGSGWR